MKIMFWAHSPCIRTYKEGKALRAHGLDVVLVHKGKTVSERYAGLRAEDAFSDVWKAGQIYAPHFVEDQNVNIIHTAHPPDQSVRDLLGCGLPIVHDFHDLYSLQSDKPYHIRTEKDAAMFATGLVFTSDKMAEYVAKKHPAQAMVECVVANATDECTVVPRQRPWPKDEIHVVYLAAMPRWGERHYKDIKGVVQQLTSQGVHLHVYALIVKPEIREAAGNNQFFHLEEPAFGREKIELLTRFDAAIWSRRPNIPKQMQTHVNMACPNKLYEYWQAKLPIVCCGGLETKKLIERYQLGWMVKNFSDIRTVLAQEYKPIREVITMKEEVGKLIDLYESIVL